MIARGLFRVFVLVVFGISARAQTIPIVTDYNSKIRASLVVNSGYECISSGISNGNIKVNIEQLQAEGDLFSRVKFFKASIVYDSVTCFFLLPAFNEYIVAITVGGGCFRLKGYNENDFVAFLIRLQGNDIFRTHPRTILNEHQIPGVDLNCLYEYALKTKQNIRLPVNTLKGKYPCLKAGEDMLLSH